MKESMERIGAILRNEDYRSNLKKNMQAEEERVYCRHGMDHFLDVARIAYILNLERGLGYGKDLIYAAALLHDIGKWRQYEEGIPHSRASALAARKILPQCGFDGNEILQIADAISTHSKYDAEDNSLKYLLYKSDKLSRKCFLCAAAKKCDWDSAIKNSGFEV